MTRLIELKDKVCKFCGAYEKYLLPIIKFLLAFILFCIINYSVGFITKISTVPVAAVIALVCCFFPYGMTIFVSECLIVANLYVLSLEVALIALLIFLVVYFIYFRFSPKEGLFVILTPILFKLNIPYVLPMATGLLRAIAFADFALKK